MAKRKVRADGRYQGKILVGVIDGKQKYKYVYGSTKKEVEQKLAVLRVELGKGADLTRPMTLSFWTDRWLAREKQNMTSTWYARCAFRASVWRDRLGDRDVTKITTADLEDVLFALAKQNPATGKPSSKKTLTEYKNIICRIFAYIARNRAITFDPSNYIAVTQNAPVRRRSAVSDDVINAVRETPGEIQLPCLIMIYSGLRLGEVAALTWSDVDLKNRTISVNKSWDFDLKQIKPPKTAAGVRTVPIPPPLLDALSAAPRASLLVCTHHGDVYTHSSWRNALAAYSKQVGFPLRAHCLRHTCCTLYYEAGVDVLTAQKWMGHADASTTMGIYTHLRAQHEASNVTRLDAFFSGSVSQGCQDTPKTLDPTANV